MWPSINPLNVWQLPYWSWQQAVTHLESQRAAIKKARAQAAAQQRRR